LWVLVIPALGSAMGGRKATLVAVEISALLGWQIVTFSLRIREFNREWQESVETITMTRVEGALVRVVQPKDPNRQRFATPSPRLQAFAYDLRCVVVDGGHPGDPYYWVRSTGHLPDSYRTLTISSDGGNRIQITFDR